MAKSEYVSEMYRRYKTAASRSEKSRILDEICATCRVHRKHAIRLLGRCKHPARARTSKRGRRAIYVGAELLRVLRKIWLAANLPCSKRLNAILPLWLPGYEATEEKVTVGVREKLSELQKLQAETSKRLRVNCFRERPTTN